MTDLRFIGDWSLWLGLVAALLLAGGSWALYYREIRERKGTLRWLLPALRASAIVLMVLILTGPSLHHRWVLGQLARILVFVDASRSMDATDESLEPGRKLLASAALNWFSQDLLPKRLLEAHDALASSMRAGADALKTGARDDEMRTGIKQFLSELERAADGVKALNPRDVKGDSGPAKDEAGGQYHKELLLPAMTLASESQSKNPRQSAAALSLLMTRAGEWRERLRAASERAAGTIVENRNKETVETLKRFDEASRWKRAQALLLEGEKPLLKQLAERHNASLLAVSGGGAELACSWLWRGQASRDVQTVNIPKSLEAKPDGEETNLNLALKTAIEEGSPPPARGGKSPENESDSARNADSEKADKLKATEKMAVVILTDGRHNYGDSPLQLARVCGARGIPVFTVGLGGQRSLDDLAVSKVDAPRAVFHKDRVKGKITLKDNMQPDKPFALRVLCEGQTLWEKNMKTDGSGLRVVDFDFPVEKLLEERMKKMPSQTLSRTIPLKLRAVAAGLDTDKPAAWDKDPNNNERTFCVMAVSQRSRILILDGRPRWEFRYLRNLFERDEKWETTAFLADPSLSDGGIKRGAGPQMFPDSRERLFTYDLIILGDLPSGLFKKEELEWMRDFVGSHGGGLILIDGQRDCLRRYSLSPLEPLIPVKWGEESSAKEPSALRLTEQGQLRLTKQGLGLNALSLAPDARESASIWTSLKPPHWLSPVTPLPGAEVLMEAVVDDKAAPAMIWRRYGAGKVLFSAYDESWRFRYRVADLYHERYWNQVAGWIMARSYSVSDKFISLDAGGPTYNPGQTAEIRAQVRDADGKPNLKTVVKAQLWRDGKMAATMTLDPDEESAEFRGKTGALEKGDYSVRLEVAGYPEEQMQAKAEFFVQPPDTGERVDLTCDEDLLRQMAANSGGEYFREEYARDLPDRLKPLSEGTVIESDTVLSQSYWWFVPVIAILMVEWILRKRSGLL
ncbi:MAG: hypothetical protein NTX50_32055 [Candidatus Sumerlaeota bacterium]|nr:hypothetical protein [Candidatus Sumerlaeota bacterium]